ncbi:caspase family protein, partial [Larkinella rosea]
MKIKPLVCLLIYSLIGMLSYPLRAQTLHFIVFADTDDPNIGSPNRKTYNYLTQDLAPVIAKQAGLALSVSGHIGANFRLANLNKILTALKPEADDVIFFYFAGHGFNNQLNEYPSLVFNTGLDIETNAMSLLNVYRKLQGLNARMTIVIGEASNKDHIARTKSGSQSDMFSPTGLANPLDKKTSILYDTQRIQKLFRATQGGLLVSSCKRGQFSYSNATGGWMNLAWRNAFQKVINDDKKKDGEPASWTTLINQVVNETKESAREAVTEQEPQFINELASMPTKRFALVLGNSAYQHVSSLESRPVNDA